jgi:ubiquinone biosynthesis protein
MNMLLSCVTLACFRVFMATGIEREYAIELIGDMAWIIYEKWGRFPILIARLLTRDPREQLRMSVNMFLRFPFTPPGYVFERLPSSDGISLDMLRCPVAEYFHKQDASDLCVGTWCNLDFALAEMWGGWLERTETLAVGCARCDFRFRANARE